MIFKYYKKFKIWQFRGQMIHFTKILYPKNIYMKNIKFLKEKWLDIFSIICWSDMLFLNRIFMNFMTSLVINLL
jgi:hypothetical protein